MLINGTEFGQRLRRILEDKHITRNQAAASLQIPGPQLSRYLHGQIPDTRTLLKLARWGNCSMEWLLLGAPDDVDKARDLDHRDDDTSRALLWHLPPLKDEFERLRQLWNNLEHDYRPRVVQLLELLQPTAQTKVDLIAYLDILIKLIQEDHASRPSILTQRLGWFRTLQQVARERLPLESLELLWDETGRYLYAHQHSPTSLSYPAFIEQLVTRLDKQQRQALKQARKDICTSLAHFRTARTFPSVIATKVLQIAAQIPETPAALSRVSWRKSRAFRRDLEHFLGQALANEMGPTAWESFYREACRILLDLPERSKGGNEFSGK